MARFVWLVGVVAIVMAPWSSHGAEPPPSIVTHNVPSLPISIDRRLDRYSNVRQAIALGWQGDALIIGTRFAETLQLHRVREPLGYREQLTFYREPIAGIALPAHGKQDLAIISRDVGGTEFYQLFVENLNTGESRLVTDGKSRYSDSLWGPKADRFVYTTTERNGQDWDLHIQTLDGEVTELLQTDGGWWAALDWSADGQRLLVHKYVSINESYLFELEIETKSLRALAPVGATAAIGDAYYDDRGGVFYTSDSEGEFRRLYRLNLKDGTSTPVGETVEWDVEQFSLAPSKDQLLVSTNVDGLSELKLYQLPDLQPLSLPDLPKGILVGADFSADGRRLALSLNQATSPTDVYVLERDGKAPGKLTRWTKSELGGLDRSAFIAPEQIRYPSFDDRQIPAVVYRPNTPGPHPVIISIHGGPEGQYRPYFSTTVQAYINEMGVTYIAPNVRGSRGYGKSYLKLDNGRLREDSVKDIGALLDWIDQQPELDSDRVGVLGGSYGGYMVLASMVHYGDRLTAAAERVGISNFVTFLENTQPYRQDLRRAEYGDERDPQMRAFLQSISPLNDVDKMITPVLIAQGANDPRVPASESEQMRLALESREVPVWYILAKDEGHGFRKKSNQTYYRAAAFTFFQRFLIDK